jgi:regulatory protein
MRSRRPLARPERVPEAGTVTEIAITGRGGRQAEITLNTGTTYTLDINVFLDYDLQVGTLLDLAAVTALLQADDVAAAKLVATRQLAYRARSTAELRKTLADRGFSEDAITEVVERFLELGYLNDAEFARRWIASRDQIAPRGSRLLRQELRQKGIDAELADQSLAEAELDDLETARRLAERRMDRLRDLPPDKARQRLAGYLERRGFSHEVVRKIDRELFPR